MVRASPSRSASWHTHTQMLTTSNTRYQAKLVKRPLLTQVVTTAILFGTGDVIAQQAVDKKGLEKHDLARTGRMVLYGGGESLSVFCPCSHS